jgi:hypothetical protein
LTEPLSNNSEVKYTMAKADYVAADRRNDDKSTVKDNPVTAGDKVAETVYAGPDAENKVEADGAGVLSNSFIGYETALNSLAARPDMESFDAYTRRSYGVTGATFAAGAHMRQLPNRSGGPTGYANDPDNAIVDPDGGGPASGVSGT